MSSECVGWVFRYSPAKGAAFQVHLAAADSANDQHGYELWMRQHWLAAKARVSRRAVSDALAWLTTNGFLELLESGQAVGSANRYRFLMPPGDPIWTPEGRHVVHTPPAGGAHPPVHEVHTGQAPRAHIDQENPRGEPKESRALFAPDELPDATPPTFDEFWSWWPYKRGTRAEALKAWGPACARASAAVIVDGARRYAQDPNLPPKAEARFVPHAATWLRRDGWTEGPLPPRSGSARRMPVASDRSTTGRVPL